MDSPKYPSIDGTEQELLEKHIQFCRDTLVYKVEGLTDELGRKQLGKTPTSALGIVKHMLNVEMSWFHSHFAGLECEFAWSDKKPDGDFEVQPHETVEFLLSEYKKVCAKSKEICAQHNVDDLSVKKSPRTGKHTPLRWIYLHMIEETGRHNGHLDIYRELLDGVVDWQNG